ncbi:DUF7010 family protein [Lederbergia wuyishanensis]|uniref:Uncharacterized protein n=1 Tax=Lederbergia wuyishanensis TaxID=1347903 RepID=A0ABU0D9K3_9BACI|nr:hypothetical protein [Lederbergia wuyishanensis]MCJ8009380.1 hypothetical protein [Lederbergia wuyishanensis]MDQ0345011.1 hypothetical protein [Lederbergia wuyishanensis]
MDYKNMTLEELKKDLIIDAQKGHPFFLAGAIYWLAMGVLGFFLEGQQLALFYLVGTGSIFPLAILLGNMQKVNILSKNPLGVLGGIIGGIQAFYIPIWIVIYMKEYQLLPMAIGVLAGSHFFPYLWIYKSRAYLFFTVALALVSFIFGYIIIDQAFLLLPFLLTALYLLMVAALKMETKAFYDNTSINMQ